MTSDPFRLRRTITLSSPADPAAVGRLGEAEGVLSVAAEGKRLIITYDARRTGMAALERLAVSVGLAPSNRLWARWARAWAAFQDDNLRNQAKVVHRCCSGFTPPERE